MITISPSDIELVASLHSHVVASHHSSEYTNGLIFLAITTAVTIGLYNNAVSKVLKMIFNTHYKLNEQKFQKIAYQITNLTVNLCLGLYGIHHHISSLPQINKVPITERIAGFPEYAHFAALQIGYNAWALPFGYYRMNETKAMVLHHIAVLLVACLGAFRTNGFKYYAPFFMGLIEISSVPLSIMNFCRDNRDLTREHCPKLVPFARILFAVTFLIVRVLMWTPLMADVLWISALLGLTCNDLCCKVGICAFSASAVFLTFLQFFWATLIVKGLLKMLMPEGKIKML